MKSSWWWSISRTACSPSPTSTVPPGSYSLTAARRNKRMVTQAEFEEAKDKVMMGAERKSLVMTEEEKMLTAYHEGGHAIVGLNVVATDPIHKATIIPRGRALGMVMQLPERDKLSMSLEQ